MGSDGGHYRRSRVRPVRGVRRNSLIAFAETFEKGHGEAPAVSSTVTKIVSVGGDIVFGLLLGAVIFVLAYYFLEPAISGAADTKNYIVASAGFLTVSGVPWALLPPQPLGVSQTLPAETRLLWCGIMMATGAVATGLAVYDASPYWWELPKSVAATSALATLTLIPVVALLAPANSVAGLIRRGSRAHSARLWQRVKSDFGSRWRVFTLSSVADRTMPKRLPTWYPQQPLSEERAYK